MIALKEPRRIDQIGAPHRFQNVGNGDIRRQQLGRIRRDVELGFLAALATAFTSGTVYDLGLMFYILAGTIAALTSPLPAQTEALSTDQRRYSQKLAVLGGWR